MDLVTMRFGIYMLSLYLDFLSRYMGACIWIVENSNHITLFCRSW